MTSDEPAAIRILLLEDSPIDAELVAAHLRKVDLAASITRVMTRTDFLKALQEGGFDIVLADYSLPDFDGLTALTLVRELQPHWPFVFVSGVLGEEFATNALQLGASDYVLKRNLSRLPSAIKRALEQALERAERRHAEAALLRSEMNARLSAEAAKLGLWEYEPSHGEMRWDDMARRIFGLERDEEPSLSLLRLRCHPLDWARLQAALQMAMADAGRVQIDFRITLPGGLLHWVALHGQALHEGKAENGEAATLRMVGVVRDITEERQAQDYLRAEAVELERQVAIRTAERDRIWQLSDELFAVLDMDGRIRRVNPAWNALLGEAVATLDGNLLSPLLHPDDRNALADALDVLRKGGRPERRLTRLRQTGDGWRWVSWSAVAEGNSIYLVGRDVTSERRAHQALAERNIELAAQIDERQRMEETLRQMQRLEAIGQLTSGVAHDFNNLLTVILGNIGFAERDKNTSEKLLQRLQTMRSAAERGASLTTQLLAFSRRQRLEPKAVDLNETVVGMHELLRSTMGGSNRIETKLKTGLWEALVDPTQIELIILNLAINARDAMEVGGSLTLETDNVSRTGKARRPEEPPPGDYVMLSVRDTGTGMTPEVLAKAFEPFFTTKEVGKGSGLGLAQVYGFAAQSGGGVTIETRLGEGTIISVFLPRTNEAKDSEAEIQPTTPVNQASSDDHMVLVVDDDHAVRDVTSALLRETGYQVLEASSGSAALELLRGSRSIDLLVADFAMPGMSGVELARICKTLRPNLPVLFVTGYADLKALENIDELFLIRKPFRAEELKRKAFSILNPAKPLVRVNQLH